MAPDANRGSVAIGVAGCGNIGSHVIPLVARVPGVRRMLLCDKDAYSESNIVSQGIEIGDVGRPKVDVMADRVRRIAPDVEIVTFAAPLADVPIGLLAAECWIGGLDSNAARTDLNAIAWHLGSVLIDGGVLSGAGWFGKVDTHIPSPEGACLECAWDSRMYEALEQTRPCGQDEPAPTGAPAALGALVAAIQALEVEKLVAGGRQAVAAGRRLVIDASGHHLASSRLPRNPRCLFDHQVWKPLPFPRDVASFPVAGLSALARGAAADRAEIRVYGDAFVTALVCGRCGAAVPAFALARSIVPDARPCPRCGGGLSATGFHRRDWIDVGHLSPADGGRTLPSIGVRPGDVIGIRSPAGIVRFVLGGQGPQCT